MNTMCGCFTAISSVAKGGWMELAPRARCWHHTHWVKQLSASAKPDCRVERGETWQFG
jgi:hypothetical protein